jgi:hypothetical protein
LRRKSVASLAREMTEVINQPPAAFCIHVPMLEMTVAVHTTAKTRCFNGLSGALGLDDEGEGEEY